MPGRDICHVCQGNGRVYRGLRVPVTRWWADPCKGDDPLSDAVRHRSGGNVLESTGIPVIGPCSLGLSLCLGHIGALLGLAVPPGTGAVVYLAGGIDPHLTGGTCGCWGAC